jgi:hypothetical protein
VAASALHDGGVRRSIGVSNPDGQAAAIITNQLELVTVRHRSVKLGRVIPLEITAIEHVLSPLIELHDRGTQHNSEREKHS